MEREAPTIAPLSCATFCGANQNEITDKRTRQAELAVRLRAIRSARASPSACPTARSISSNSWLKWTAENHHHHRSANKKTVAKWAGGGSWSGRHGKTRSVMVMIMADIEYTIGHKNRNRSINRGVNRQRETESRRLARLACNSWRQAQPGEWQIRSRVAVEVGVGRQMWTELAAKIKSLGAQGKNLAKNYKFRWNVNVIAALISIGCIGSGSGSGSRVPASPDGAGILAFSICMPPALPKAADQ